MNRIMCGQQYVWVYTRMYVDLYTLYDAHADIKGMKDYESECFACISCTAEYLHC